MEPLPCNARGLGIGVIVSVDTVMNLEIYLTGEIFSGETHDAAQLYREIRKMGFTIRKPNDCLSAVYAIKDNIKLLHDDKDFNFIAMNSELLIQPTD